MPTSKPFNKISLGHFLVGATPVTIAGLLILSHSLRPIVSHNQQGILLTVAGCLVSVSLAVFVWCVVASVAERFGARDRIADERQEAMKKQAAERHEELLRLLRHQDAAIQKLHGRFQDMERKHSKLAVRLATAETETAHLRELVLDDNLVDAGGGTSQPGLRPVRLGPSRTRWPRAGGDRPEATVIPHGPQRRHPVWVEPHKNKFRIRDLVDGRKVTVESGFPTKTSAQKRKQRLEIEQLDYGPLKAGADKVLFRDWADAWWKSHARTVAPGTAKSEGNRVRRHIIGRLGHLPIGRIDATVVREWIEQLAEPEDAEYDPLGPKSIKNVHGYLFMAMETAVHERVIRSNPCGFSKLPVWTPRQPRFLTQAELGRVLALIPVKSRPLAVVLAGTGCRAGEALGLKWRHVDILGGRIRFETQMRVVGGRPVDAPLKTKASRRTVGIGPSVSRVLAELVDVDPDAWVFKHPNGDPVRYETFRKIWFRALNGDGTASKPPTEFAGLHVHDLRHTHAAHLIAARRPLTSIQRRLGHSSIRVTSDIYGGLLPEVEDDTAAAAEAALAEVDLSGIGGGIGGESRCEGMRSGAMASDAETEEPQVNG